MLSWPPIDTTMTLYQEIRTAALEMHGKVLRATQHLDFDGVRIAKRMTVPVLGRNIVFPSASFSGHLIAHFVAHFVENGPISTKCATKCATKSRKSVILEQALFRQIQNQ